MIVLTAQAVKKTQPKKVYLPARTGSATHQRLWLRERVSTVLLLAKMSATTAALSGLQGLQQVYTMQQNYGAANAACLNMMYLQGPYGGADPSDRFAVWDVKKTNDGLLADKVFVNGIKAQGASEALKAAGVAAPHLSIPKKHVVVDAVANVSADGKNFNSSVYGVLPYNKQVFSGGAGVPSVTTGLSTAPVVATFSNGVSIIGAPAKGQAVKPVTGLAALGVGSSVSGTPPQVVAAGVALGTGIPSPGDTAADASFDMEYDTGSLAGQLQEGNDVIEGSAGLLWSVPSGPGTITTLQPSGARAIQALGAGDITTAMLQTGSAGPLRGLYGNFGSPFAVGPAPPLAPAAGSGSGAWGAPDAASAAGLASISGVGAYPGAPFVSGSWSSWGSSPQSYGYGYAHGYGCSSGACGY